jgi:hypothetical protein
MSHLKLKPLQRLGALAVPAPETVLHELVTGEPVSVPVGVHRVRVPKPNLPVVEIGDEQAPMMSAVVLGPPWSLLDDIVAGRPNAELHLKRWLAAAIRRQYLLMSSYPAAGVMGFAKGDPRVPEGEVWIGEQGIAPINYKSGVAIRYPIASSTSAQWVRIRRCDGTGIWINDRALVQGMQGDSDGDLLFVIWGEPGTAEPVELPDTPPVDFAHAPIQPSDPKILTWTEQARGHKAREAIGLLTWEAWLLARANADLAEDEEAFRRSWADAYDRYTQYIEHVMDGRKTGQGFNPYQSTLAAEIGPLTRRSAEYGVQLMVASRWNTPINLLVSPEEILQQYWSGRWTGVRPVQVTEADNTEANPEPQEVPA